MAVGHALADALDLSGDRPHGPPRRPQQARRPPRPGRRPHSADPSATVEVLADQLAADLHHGRPAGPGPARELAQAAIDQFDAGELAAILVDLGRGGTTVPAAVDNLQGLLCEQAGAVLEEAVGRLLDRCRTDHTRHARRRRAGRLERTRRTERQHGAWGHAEQGCGAWRLIR